MTLNDHILITPETCNCDKSSDQKCPVCDWGLGVCSICGAAESDLDNPCIKNNGLGTEIETLSQRIAMLTGALNPKDRQEVLFWFSVKTDLVCDMIKINHELDKILIGKLK